MESTPDAFSTFPKEKQASLHHSHTLLHISTGYLIPSPVRLTRSGKKLISSVIPSETWPGELEEILKTAVLEQVFSEEEYFLSFYTKLESGELNTLPFYRRWEQQEESISKYLRDNHVSLFSFWNLVGFAVLGQAVEQGQLTEETDQNYDYRYRKRVLFQSELPLSGRQ